MEATADGFEFLGPIEDNPSMFLIARNDRFFRVSAATWKVIDGIASGKSDNALRRDLEASAAGCADDEVRLKKIRSYVLSQLPALATPRKPSQLWGTVDLVGQEKLNRLVKALPIFPRDVRWFYPLFAAAVAVNIVCLTFLPRIWVRVPGAQLSRETLLHSAIVFVSMVLIMVLHELSHAAAASRFGLRPAKIGAGFFLIFPAMFADVTEIWRLRAAKRIVVNLAGIFAQLWVSVLLASSMLVVPANWVPTICAVYVVNIGTVMLNLFPFAKLDGYWVLADAIGCPNLHAGAFQALARAAGRGQEDGRTTPLKESALAAFGVAHLLFYGMVALIAVTAVSHFVRGILGSPDPLLFVKLTVRQHPVAILTSGFLMYRLSRSVVRVLRPAGPGEAR